MQGPSETPPIADDGPIFAAKACPLELEHISFSYGERKALDSVSLKVLRGQTVGLLGPNGSGKSTLLRIAAGLERGEGKILYRRLPRERIARTFRRHLGVVFQSPALDQKLSCKQNLELAALGRGIPKRVSASRVSELLDFAELTDRANDAVSTLSGGMRRRLDVARALLHQPELLFLDEPSSGLDEASFRKLWRFLEQMQKRSELAIVVATHRPDEAERCDRLLLLREGRTVANATPDELRRQLSDDAIELEVKVEQTVEKAKHTLAELGFEPTADGKRLFVSCKDGHLRLPEIVDALGAATLRTIALREPSLADAFLQLTGASLDQEQAEGQDG